MTEIGIISASHSGEDLVVEWKINDFFTLSEEDDICYYSPDFSFDSERWCLLMYPNGSSQNYSSGHVDLEICKNMFGHSIKQSLSLSLSLKTVKGEKYNEQHCAKDFENLWLGRYHTYYRFIPRSELARRRSELVPEGVLTVVCTVNMTSARSASTEASASAECCHCKWSFNTVSLSSHQKKCMYKPVKCPDCLEVVQLQKWLDEHECQQERTEGEATASGSSTNPEENEALHDFKELFLKKEDCDVTIKVKGSEFPAHRLILKARSSVFASTFRQDMKESATGVLEINDCDPSTFSDFLCFLYCADVQLITQESVFDLFRLADKYQVLGLRSKCLQFMKNNLTIDTFCETITLALRHSEIGLMKLSTDYFTKNAPKIIVTVKWQTFLAENPTESNELFIKLLVPNSS